MEAVKKRIRKAISV